MFLRKMKVFIISLICAFALTFLLGEIESNRISAKESFHIESENDKQLIFLENIFQSITSTIDQTAKRYNGECSDKFLTFMRKSIFNIDGVVEIGIINNEENNGILVCSSWGGNNLKVKKPSPHDGFIFSGPHTSNFYNERISVIKKTTETHEFNVLIKQSSIENLLQNIRFSFTPDESIKLEENEKQIHSKFISNISYVFQYKTHIKTSNLFYALFFSLSFSLLNFILIPYLIYSFKRNRLEKKIKNNFFFNVYQPIVDANTNDIFSYEVFTRCKGKDNAIGIMEEIKRYNLHVEHTLRQFEKLEEEKTHFDCQNFQINLSAKHLIDNRLVTYLSKIAIASRRELIIEITEDEDLFKNRVKIKSTMQKLRSLEYRFALDDFGSGFSNFAYIFEFEFDFIKIDKSVLRFNNEAFFQSFVKIFNTLDMPCIIEGVEDDQDKEKLDLIEIKYHQGWLYGKPQKAPPN